MPTKDFTNYTHNFIHQSMADTKYRYTRYTHKYLTKSVFVVALSKNFL